MFSSLFIPVFLLLVLCWPVSGQYGSLKTISVLDSIPSQYDARVASFGLPIVTSSDDGTESAVFPSRFLVVNLMVPPDSLFLCEFPESLLIPDVTSETSDNSVLVPSPQEQQQQQQTISEPLHTSSPDDLPIALLVSVENCSAEQKAKVAMEIQQRVHSKVQYLILYSSFQNESEPIVLHADDNDESSLAEDIVEVNNNNTETDNNNDNPDELNIGILHIPYQNARGLGVRMEERSRTANFPAAHNPFLLQPGNENWRFRLDVTDYQDNNGNIFNTNNSLRNRSSSGSSFFWFRLSLFALLILSPCIRGAYLWHRAGGRIIWRRHPDTQRIIGLVYVPPMPYWMTAGRFAGAEEPRQPDSTHLVSQEQFDSLPRVKYVHKLDDDDDDSGNEEANAEDDDDNTALDSQATTVTGSVAMSDQADDPPVELQHDVYDGGAAVSSATDEPIGDDEPEIPVILSRGSSSGLSSSSPPLLPTTNDINNNVNDIEQPPLQGGNTSASIANNPDGDNNDVEQQQQQQALAPKNYCCSICLDDFEPSEEIVVLPHCQHGFHAECIHPWLTQRQGCCPLCKNNVIPPGADNEDNDDDSNPNDNDVSSRDGDDVDTQRQPQPQESYDA